MMRKIEKKIAQSFKAKEALYTTNGTSALYLCFLHCKNLGKYKVALPSIICPQVACAALKAGLELVFSQPNLKDYNIDFKALKKLYKKEKFDILCLAHLYGHLCDERLFDFAKKHKILLIEDSAQSYKINPKSDFSVLSFGHTKFLSNANAGGAILSSCHKLAPLKHLNSKLALKPKNLNELFEKYKKEFYSLNPLDKNYFQRLKNLFLKYCFIFKATRKNKILEKKLLSFQKKCRLRKEKMKLYQRHLKHGLIKEARLNKDSISWRYTFRLIKDREKFLYKLREKNVDCSSWYMNNEKIFEAQISPKSAYLERQLVNLWCDESISKKQILKNIKMIKAIISSL